MRSKLSLLIAAVGVVAAATAGPSVDAVAEPPAFRVGAGTADITWHPDPDRLRQFQAALPDDPISHAGVHTRSYAKAIYVDGPQPFAIVRADLLLITTDMYEAVTRRVRRDLGLDASRVIVAATHTHVSHSGLFPHLVHGALYKSNDPREMSFIADGIAESVRTAARNVRSARLAVGSGSVTSVPVNRRYTDRELLGARPYGNDLERLDPELGVLRFDDAATGRPIAVVMNYGVHPVVLIDNPLNSSDFVGMAERAVSSAMDAPALWLTGAQGDQDPVYVRYSYPEAEWTAREFAREAVRVASSLRSEPIVRAGVLSKVIPLPEDPAGVPTSELGGTPRLPYPAPASLLIPSYVRLHAVELATRSGSTALLGWPGEPIRDIGVALKAAARTLGYDRAYVLGLANDWAGYWVTPEEYDRGLYETTFHFYGRDAAGYVQRHVIDLADARLTGRRPERVSMTPKATADRAMVAALAEAGMHAETGGVSATVPDGEPEGLEQPQATVLTGLASFTWRGGSPNVARGWIPAVEVQRSTERGWVTVAREGTGELLLRLATPAPGDTRWTATWQATPELPAGSYRFFAEGRRQTYATDVTYTVASDPFEVGVCTCIAASEPELDGGVVRVRGSYEEPDGGFRLLPETVTTGRATLEAVHSGGTVENLELSFVRHPGRQRRTVTVHDLSGRDLPVTITAQTELGAFEASWTGPPDAIFRFVRIVDSAGNTVPSTG